MKTNQSFCIQTCALQKETGPGKLSMKRFYYDMEMKKCLEFTYGGMKGNGNNFNKLEECQQECSSYNNESNILPICYLQPIRGPCLALILSWYYDINERKCIYFIYSGCDGNANRFATQEECESSCSGAADNPPPNLLPPCKPFSHPRCQRDICAGLAGIKCCDGYGDCIVTDENPDAIGYCSLGPNAPTQCQNVTQTCGGIAGIKCCDGLRCDVPATPDAFGVCKPNSFPGCVIDMCAGFAGFQCCDGYYCFVKDTFPYAGGQCFKIGVSPLPTSPTCSGYYGFCGGFTPLGQQMQCCWPYQCVYGLSYITNAPGLCKLRYWLG